MASFTTQVGYLAGDTSSYTSEVTQWLDDAVKEIVSPVSAVNTENAKVFSQKSASFTTASPLSISENAMVVAVETLDLGTTRLARKIPLEEGFLATNTSSMFYRDSSDPGYYLLENSVNIVGEGSTSNFAYMTIFGTVTDSATPSIAYFPESLYPQVVRYAAIKLLQAKVEDLVETDEDIELAGAMTASMKQYQGEYNQAFQKWGVSV